MKTINLMLAIWVLFIFSCSNSSVDDELEDGSQNTEVSENDFEGDLEEMAENDEGSGEEFEERKIVISDKEGTYRVKNGDTYMWIAFKLYGDYSKWKLIRRYNDGATLKSGMTLRYQALQNSFEWNQNGEPHLIMRGETLGIISEKHYNTPSRWRNIWKNNELMIKNPNLIFAGFTLYYVQDDSVAMN